MNGQSYTVVVEYEGRPAKEKVAAIGGGHMTADQLAQQYVDVDAFPGAKSVIIHENEPGIALPKKMQDLLKQRRQMASKLRPKTPVPKVMNRDGNARNAVLRKADDPFPGPYVGEKSIDLPASPAVNSPAAQEARAIANLNAGESAEPASTPADSEPAAGNGGSPAENESEGSQPSEGQPGQVSRRKR